MHLESIRIQRLRCLNLVDLPASPRQNLLIGDNGAGKTSILEGLYLLGRGLSFRSHQSRQYISEGHDDCVVSAQRVGESESKTRIALQARTDGIGIRIGSDRTSRLSELARLCPVLIMEPGLHRLLEDGPVLRRRYLDWSVFHVEPQYLQDWQRYSRALRQRNALLRQGQRAALSAWDEEYVASAQRVHAHRQAVFAELSELVKEVLAQFMAQDMNIRIDYRSGWNRDADLSELLLRQRETDLERGFTQSGPHRAELRVGVDGHLAKDSLSRGQQKLVVTAMVLGQAQHFRARLGIDPILLVDDLASELGASSRDRLLQYLRTYQGQSFITSLDERGLVTAVRDDARMFHVKHGQLEAVL